MEIRFIQELDKATVQAGLNTWEQLRYEVHFRVYGHDFL